MADGQSKEALLGAELAENGAARVEMFQGFRSQVLVEVAWIAARAGDADKARAAAQEALTMSEAKGNVVWAAVARTTLEEATA